MEKRKRFGQWLEQWILGKGFYIVLLLSALAVGTLAYLAADRTSTDVEMNELTLSAGEETPEAVAAMGEEVTVPLPTRKPEVKTTMKQPETAPVFVAPVEGEIMRPYDISALSYDKTMGDWRTHSGVDIAADEGSRVCAITDGVVLEVRDDDLLGTTVRIDHGHGLVSIYSSLQSVPAVREGSVVSAGQVIGAVGDTALCEIGESSHLHFAMERSGETVDPTEYLS